KLFIETMNHPSLTYVVRGEPVLNDATIAEADYVGLHKVARVISNGYDAPSTIIGSFSDEFMEAFNEADVIISKGQGNLEVLLSVTDPRIFYLLMVKCDVIGKHINVPKGNFIVAQNPIAH
ncbi:MAG: hypothetical protein C0594_09705, partial [Marinilabiliales bacterium]